MISPDHKDRVIALRSRGQSYGQIAKTTGISRNTVISICRRTGISLKVDETPKCPNCGEEFEPGCGRKFCSDTCRKTWWHTHPQLINKKAIYAFTCKTCNKEFTAYGNAGRKYCSHACYVTDRFGGQQ